MIKWLHWLFNAHDWLSMPTYNQPDGHPPGKFGYCRRCGHVREY